MRMRIPKPAMGDRATLIAAGVLALGLCVLLFVIVLLGQGPD
jgi:hypothetical protein